MGHPFDTIKVRTQSSSSAASSSTFTILKETLAKEGFRGLYKGMASPLSGMAGMSAISFLCYGEAKYLLQPAGFNPSVDELPLTSIALAGGFSGAVLSLIEGPVDAVKTKVQVEGMGQRVSIGSGEMAKRIFATHGVRGLFQGLGVTIARNTLANGCYFASFDAVRRVFVTPGEHVPIHISILGGSAAGIGYWVPSLWLDVIKSNLQADAFKGGKYSGIIDCARKLYAREGMGVFFKGWIPCLLRSAPGNAALFVTLNTVYKLFHIADFDPLADSIQP